MTQVAEHVGVPILPERLHARLGALGLTLALAGRDGSVTVQGQARPLETMVAQAPAFAQALRQHVRALQANPSQAVAVWPGVWVVPLPECRRRTTGRTGNASFLFAMMISAEFLSSEQFLLVCDQQQLDSRAVASRIDLGSLVGTGEVQRLAGMLLFMQQDLTELERRTSDVQTLSQQLGDSYEELSLLYKLSTNMAVDQPPMSFLEDACRDLQEVMGLRWMALLLSDQGDDLHDLSGGLVAAGHIDCSTGVLKSIGRQLIAQQPASGVPRVIDDTRTLGMPHLTSLARHLLVVSLLRDGKTFGVLFGGDKLNGSHISTVDSKLCSSLANSMSIFLQNTMLYEDMQAMFMGTLHALTSSIDAKDSYTHGHSERVALMSQLLAEAAGLDPQSVERIYIAGLVHDVGKIGVPEAVLCKPGKLTPEEFDLIKMHPEIGARILQDIKQMEDLIPGVLYHHERWDGKGYPVGLAGGDIPLFGRLIGLADAFDAMSSNRTYRRAMPTDRIMEEIKRCAGTQFDPELASKFVGLDLAPLHELASRHHDLEFANTLPEARP